MVKEKPVVVSFAGFDPCGGAGVLADIKTFEFNGVRGMGINTAITVQNDVDFVRCDWLDFEQIKGQFITLTERFKVAGIKIGLVKNIEIAKNIITLAKDHNSDVKIVWDPVLSASSGFDFQNINGNSALFELCKEITLFTPNYNEFKRLFPEDLKEEDVLSQFPDIKLLLKGGHHEIRGYDNLYDSGTKHTLKPVKDQIWEKHGSGCVLSSAICSYLVQGVSILESCRLGKLYVECFLASNRSLLGDHNFFYN